MVTASLSICLELFTEALMRMDLHEDQLLAE